MLFLILLPGSGVGSFAKGEVGGEEVGTAEVLGDGSEAVMLSLLLSVALCGCGRTGRCCRARRGLRRC